MRTRLRTSNPRHQLQTQSHTQLESESKSLSVDKMEDLSAPESLLSCSLLVIAELPIEACQAEAQHIEYYGRMSMFHREDYLVHLHLPLENIDVAGGIVAPAVD